MLIFQGEGDNYTFTYVFITLEWKIRVRSNNCLAMNVNHVQWENDSLVFYFVKTKGDRLGEKAGMRCTRSFAGFHLSERVVTTHSLTCFSR